MMALVLILGLLSAVFAHIYRLLNPPLPLSDFQMAAIYLHEARLRLLAAERASDPEEAQRQTVVAEYYLVRSQVYTIRGEHLERTLPVARPSRKR
jgi:hypothetical protein